MKHYEFPDCDCKFPVIQENPLRIQFDPDINKIPLDCPRTWNLISKDPTTGIFQLDSHWGESLAHDLKPNDIRHLAALTAIMRPGCCDSFIGKKSVTQHYIDRKNKKEEVTFTHDVLKEILGESYGLLVFQEEAMQIASKIAGFDLNKADSLRKSIGKKLPELMAKVEKEFMNGCREAGIVDEDTAKQIFDNIRNSQRYSFNRSHAVGYAYNGYLTAYCKAHFPKAFVTSWLYYAKDKSKPHEEIEKLVQNARLLDIDIVTPDIRLLNRNFKLSDEDGRIYFGLSDVKGIGDSSIRQLPGQIRKATEFIGQPVEEWLWLDFLVCFSPLLKSTVVKGLICAGALDYFGISRTQMYYESEQYQQVKGKEIEWLQKTLTSLSANKKPSNLSSILQMLAEIPPGRKHGGCSNKNRLKKIENIITMLTNPPFSLQDNIEWLAGVEEELLGIALTCTKVEGCDITNANCDCREFAKGYNRPGPIIIAVKIDRVNEIITKKKEKMAFLSVSDISASIDSVVVFSNVWKEYKKVLLEGNVIMMSGERGKKKDSYILKRAWQL